MKEKNTNTAFFIGITLAVCFISGGFGFKTIRDLKNEQKELKEEIKDLEKENNEDDNPNIGEGLVVIEVDDLENMVNNKETFILVYSSDYCSHCIEYKPILKKVLNDYNLTAYEIKSDNIGNTDIETFKNIVDVTGTPTTMFFKDGKEISTSSRLKGSKTYDELVDFFTILGFIDDNQNIVDNTVVVPEVAGKTVSEVIAELQELGFEIADATIKISNDKVEEGKVVKTNPPSGSKRKKGTVITIYISTGDSKVTIEDYVGKNVLTVKGRLEAQGITVFVERKEVDNPEYYDENIIIEQSVKPGEKLGVKDTITLYIPDIEIKYPNFTDGTWTVEDVQQFCDEYDVTLKIVEESNKSYDEGTIFYQSRKEGYIVVSGTTLTIKVSSSE